MSNDNTEMYDTTGTGVDGSDLPSEVVAELPDHIAERDDLSLADDAMAATVNPEDTTTVPLVDDDSGEVYIVTLTDISWANKNDIFTNSLKRTGPNDGKLDFAHYYREVAKEVIVSVEPEPDNLSVWLQGLKSTFGSQLEEELPPPVSDLDERQEEN